MNHKLWPKEWYLEKAAVVFIRNDKMHTIECISVKFAKLWIPLNFCESIDSNYNVSALWPTGPRKVGEESPWGYTQLKTIHRPTEHYAAWLQSLSGWLTLGVPSLELVGKCWKHELYFVSLLGYDFANTLSGKAGVKSERVCGNAPRLEKIKRS